MTNKNPINGDRVSQLTDTEVVRLFLYLGCIKDAKLDNFATELYGSLILRGYDPLSLTVLKDDNDIIEVEIDHVSGSVIMSIPQELRIGEES